MEVQIHYELAALTFMLAATLVFFLTETFTGIPKQSVLLADGAGSRDCCL